MPKILDRILLAAALCFCIAVALPGSNSTAQESKSALLAPVPPMG
jgi:hypothetical protein